MVDPFRNIARRELVTKASSLALFIGLICLTLLAWEFSDIRQGRVVAAVVTGFSTYPDPLGMGDRPILTVRLSDGSLRQVRGSWSAVGNCTPGRTILLLQRRTALEIAFRGCSSTR